MPTPVITKISDVALGPFLQKASANDSSVMERDGSIWQNDRIRTGVWEVTKGRFSSERPGYDEIAYILSGKATIHMKGGRSYELGPGDVFVTPSGWSGVWEVTEPIVKHYVIIHEEAPVAP